MLIEILRKVNRNLGLPRLRTFNHLTCSSFIHSTLASGSVDVHSASFPVCCGTLEWPGPGVISS